MNFPGTTKASLNLYIIYIAVIFLMPVRVFELFLHLDLYDVSLRIELTFNIVQLVFV